MEVERAVIRSKEMELIRVKSRRAHWSHILTEIGRDEAGLGDRWGAPSLLRPVISARGDSGCVVKRIRTKKMLPTKMRK